MADTWTLRDAFIEELRDAYDAEKQLIRVLPKMAKAATTPGLRALLDRHLEQTRRQLVRLEQVFERLDERAAGKHSSGVAAIIEHGEVLLRPHLDAVTRDACLIASSKRLEHHTMALYATLVSWAHAMSFNAVADILQQNLDEDTAAEAGLTALAENGINQSAADAAFPESDSDGEIDVPVSPPHKASKRRQPA